MGPLPQVYPDDFRHSSSQLWRPCANISSNRHAQRGFCLALKTLQGRSVAERQRFDVLWRASPSRANWRGSKWAEASVLLVVDVEPIASTFAVRASDGRHGMKSVSGRDAVRR